MRYALLLILLLSLSIPTVSAQVVVNEICVSNRNGLQDNYNNQEDWIEIHNPTPAVVDLTGWWLGNRPGNPLKWQFPAGANVPANGYLIVFCSKRDEGGAGFHTNFQLNQTDGDQIALSNAAGVLVDEFTFTPGERTKLEHSRGRTTDGATTWSLFTTPTPGAANAGAATNYLPKPTMAPAGGFYGGAQTVTLTSPAGNTIRYTVDGSEPTAASPIYAAPIPVNATTVVRAACFGGAGSQPSFEEFHTYFINDFHSIAVISIGGGELNDLFGGTQIEPWGTMEYFGADGLLKDKAMGEYNEHGQDSWAYPQRGVDYITRDETGYNDALHHQIFRTRSRDKYQRLIIKAAAGDNYTAGPGQPAHIRDAYVMALSQIGDLEVDERSYEPCILYVNGQYWGVYDVREKVDDHDFTRITYDQDKYDIQMIKTWGGTWNEYGGAQAGADWNALRNYIETNDMGDPAAFEYVDSQYNWKSLIDYFCLNSYTVCADWLNWNTAWWRGRDPAGDKKKWRYLLWDMDATFGHYTNFTGIPDQSVNADPCDADELDNPGGQGHTVILNKLMDENEMVRNYYVNRYADLGNTLFSCDVMLPFLDSLIGNIAPEMPRQIQRWGGSMAEWEANVQVLRDFIEERCVTIQEGMVDCYDLEGPFDVVFNVDPPLSGTIRINSITPEEYPFSGIYYGNIQTELAAIPNDDVEGEWIFSHWEVFSTNVILPTTTDSLVTVDILTADSIVAHFMPPTRYDIMLDMVPRGAGAIVFDGISYTEFPVLVSAPEGIDQEFHVVPKMYYDFLYWTVKNNLFTPEDSSETHLTAKFFTTDTIIAYLEPQEYVYFTPNAFTPNGDGINDVFHPIGNVIDLETYELSIYDRWGQVIFQSTDPYEGWDGTAGGKEVPNGVFVFRAFITDAILKDRYELFGHVTLFR